MQDKQYISFTIFILCVCACYSTCTSWKWRRPMTPCVTSHSWTARWPRLLTSTQREILTYVTRAGLQAKLYPKMCT